MIWKFRMKRRIERLRVKLTAGPEEAKEGLREWMASARRYEPPDSEQTYR
jgi:hypothetical protein